MENTTENIQDTKIILFQNYAYVEFKCLIKQFLHDHFKCKMTLKIFNMVEFFIAKEKCKEFSWINYLVSRNQNSKTSPS